MSALRPRAQQKMARRTVLQSLVGVGGSFVLGVPKLSAHQTFDPESWPGKPADAFDYWVEIAEDNTVTVSIHVAEMGQGVMTSVAQLVAEELEADWKDIRVKFAPNGPAYFNRNNKSAPTESTGGSTTIRGAFNHSRRVGAAAREMLRMAAARRWGVPISDTRAALGFVYHDKSDRNLSYGALAGEAATMEPLQDVLLKPKSQWSIIGQPLKRLDTLQKVDGSAQFGLDVQLNDMLVAAVRHAPTYSGFLVSVDDTPALAIKGVEMVVALENAVAVLACGYWQAQKGLDALVPQWDLGYRADYNMESLSHQLNQGLARTDAPIVREEGDMSAALEYAHTVFEQTYETPYLAHVCMEPMTATAWVQKESVDTWVPNQGHTIVVNDVAEVLGVEKDIIRVHRTFMGGGFGRRGESDLPVQAARLSQAAGGRPVKLIWSRAEDVKRDFFRPASRAKIRVALGEDGLPLGMDVQVASPSINIRRFPDFIKGGLDPGALSGFLDSPYPLDHHQYRYAMIENGVPVGYWRSVGHSQNVFYQEAVANELAEMAGMDGLSYRKRWLRNDPRFVRLLDTLADLSGYPGQNKNGQAIGVAMNASHGTLCAHAIHLVVHGPTGFKVERIDCVVDPGVAVNPNGIVAQVESQAIDGLSSALFGKISIENGGAVNNNFDTIRLLKLAGAPEINVQVLEWDGASPGGMGEPAIPSIAPALTDALYQLKGVRIRSLPIMRQGIEIAHA
jgi:isoquinoline 1-oxidoreductase beta subunit